MNFGAFICCRPRGLRRSGPLCAHAWRMTKRAGSLAEPGDRNPYAGRSLVLAKLWMRGYMRMMRVRIDSGPAMSRYREAERGPRQCRKGA